MILIYVYWIITGCWMCNLSSFYGFRWTHVQHILWCECKEIQLVIKWIDTLLKYIGKLKWQSFCQQCTSLCSALWQCTSLGSAAMSSLIVYPYDSMSLKTWGVYLFTYEISLHEQECWDIYVNKTASQLYFSTFQLLLKGLKVIG